MDYQKIISDVLRSTPGMSRPPQTGMMPGYAMGGAIQPSPQGAIQPSPQMGLIPGPVNPQVADDTVIKAKRGEYVIPDWAVARLGTKQLDNTVAKVAKELGIDWQPGAKAGGVDSIGRSDAVGLSPRTPGMADGGADYTGTPNDYNIPQSGDSGVYGRKSFGPLPNTSMVVKEGPNQSRSNVMGAIGDVANWANTGLKNAFGLSPSTSTTAPPSIPDQSGVPQRPIANTPASTGIPQTTAPRKRHASISPAASVSAPVPATSGYVQSWGSAAEPGIARMETFNHTNLPVYQDSEFVKNAPQRIAAAPAQQMGITPEMVNTALSATNQNTGNQVNDMVANGLSRKRAALIIDAYNKQQGVGLSRDQLAETQRFHTGELGLRGREIDNAADYRKGELGLREKEIARQSTPEERELLTKMKADALEGRSSDRSGILAARSYLAKYDKMTPREFNRLPADEKSQVAAVRKQLADIAGANTGVSPSSGPPAGAPPGARQAPDGKWYVQQNGKYYLVE